MKHNNQCLLKTSERLGECDCTPHTCEVCGGNVEVVGNTTKHYRNLDKERIQKQAEFIKKMKEVITKQNTYGTWLNSVRCGADELMNDPIWED